MVNILDRVAVLLQEADSFIVPVKWINTILKSEYPQISLTVEQLTEKLRQDKRFRIFEGPKIGTKNTTKSTLSKGDMETLGFYEGPRVMLGSRIPTRREIVKFLLQKADQTFEILKKAWEIRPHGDTKVEDQLLEALAKSQRLQRELRTILVNEEKKE